jgi:hypothetical protein
MHGTQLAAVIACLLQRQRAPSCGCRHQPKWGTNNPLALYSTTPLPLLVNWLHRSRATAGVCQLSHKEVQALLHFCK